MHSRSDMLVNLWTAATWNITHLDVDTRNVQILGHMRRKQQTTEHHFPHIEMRMNSTNTRHQVPPVLCILLHMKTGTSMIVCAWLENGYIIHTIYSIERGLISKNEI